MTAVMRDAVSPGLRTTLRALKLGQMLETLPRRLTRTKGAGTGAHSHHHPVACQGDGLLANNMT